MPTQPSKKLETFPNPRLDRDYIIEIECPEFTCLCPKTGQPDFATLSLDYVPGKLCVELKSLKLYVWSYRDEKHFHEDVTNRILNDLVAAVSPRYMCLRAKFNVRGGITTTVQVEHREAGWSAPPPPPANMPKVTQDIPETPKPATKTRPAPVPLTSPPVPPAPPASPTSPEDEAPSNETSSMANDRFRMLRRNVRADAVQAAVTPVEEKPPPKKTISHKDGLFIGIDLGTTGCRTIAVNATGVMQAEALAPIPAPLRNKDQITQDPTLWWKAVNNCLTNLLKKIDPERVLAIAVDGTSGTLLLTDNKGNPVTPAIMYNDQRAVDQAALIASHAGSDSGAQNATSSLAKLLWFNDRKMEKRAAHALHQADWISGRLTGLFGHSDYNNCLKMGFDASKMAWPKWFNKLGFNISLLPEIHAPGELIGTISAESAKTFGLPTETQVLAGTTDGVASFLAAGATEPGHGVTALGTTLVLKLLSNKPVFSLDHGVYSHRLGKYWLAGGASNSGGAVLLQYFKVEQMQEMTLLLDPETYTGLDYYPLPEIGERFPVCNPEMEPRLEPLPGNSITFFQGMLEGIARIEAEGYLLLQHLGAPAATKIYTTGGGAQNQAWERLRERILDVKIKKARSESSAYGTALLAAGITTKTYR